MKPNPQRLAPLALPVAAAVLLYVAPNYAAGTSLPFIILNWIVLAESFNMFAGLTGYVNFGHVVFYGVGGYIGGLLMANSMASPYAAVLAGGLGSALLALGMSLPTTRLRGAYFAIATLSINEAVFVIFDNWDAVGSAPGFTIPIADYLPLQVYYVMAIVAALCVATMYFMTRSKFGVAMQAIRQQEKTASSIGVNAAFYKTVALVISGFFAGLAGALAIWQIAFIDPTNAFDVRVTLNSISMVMLGGLGTVVGPIIGGTLLYGVGDYLDRRYPFLQLIVLGVVIIGVVMAMPQGIVGASRRFFQARRIRREESEGDGSNSRDLAHL